MNKSILFLVVVTLLVGCTSASPTISSTANATQPITPYPTCAVPPTCTVGENYPGPDISTCPICAIPPTCGPCSTPGHLVYLWPHNLPEGYHIYRPGLRIDEYGFQIFVEVPTPVERKGGWGYYLYLEGGSYTAKSKPDIPREKPEIVYIRGNQGQFVQREHLNCSVYWQENGNSYVVGGFGVERDFVLAVAETAYRDSLVSIVQNIIQLP